LDPITTVGAGLAVLGSKDLLDKVLGPTAEYFGGEVKGLVQKCNLNLDNIFIKAKNKLGDRLDEEGSVSPRILKNIIDEGRFCEDDLAAEYYGGVLASSKSSQGRDDRGIALIAIIKSISVYQLRLHYLVYYILKKVGHKNNRIGIEEERSKNRIFLPYEVFLQALELSDGEDPEVILSHAVSGLVRNELVGSFYQYGSQSYLLSWFPNCPKQGGLIIEPSMIGAELFLWAEGINKVDSAEILNESVVIGSPVIPVIEGYSLLN
jgi:hypothetical protein